jgi:hypothetical protein
LSSACVNSFLFFILRYCGVRFVLILELIRQLKLKVFIIAEGSFGQSPKEKKN